VVRIKVNRPLQLLLVPPSHPLCIMQTRNSQAIGLRQEISMTMVCRPCRLIAIRIYSSGGLMRKSRQGIEKYNLALLISKIMGGSLSYRSSSRAYIKTRSNHLSKRLNETRLRAPQINIKVSIRRVA
jgi:hypothetical protein